MSNKRILLVEDDLDTRDTVAELLRDRGYDVVACANGAEALERLRQGADGSDLILLDLMMPVMNGWQFRREQRLDPQLAAIPVIAVSANGGAEASTIDAEEFLNKPLRGETLLDAVERVLLSREREQARDRLLEADRLASLGTLSAGVAHEINNPLTFAMVSCELLERLLRDPVLDRTQVTTLLRGLQDGLARIRHVVSDLSTLSRRGTEERSAVDVRSTLRATIGIALSTAEVEPKVIEQFEKVPAVFANEARLGQVFLNLLVNAIQAIPPDRAGQIRVRVQSVADGARVRVEVADNGTGIAEPVLPRIFDPFFTTKPIGAGTGLGLPISRSIIASFGGTITLTTTLG